MNRFLSALLAASLAAPVGCRISEPPYPDVRTRSEIDQFAVALAAFQEAYGVAYVPSRIKLSETCNYPQRGRPNTLDSDSVEFLQTLWPELVLAPGAKIDWNGDGQIKGDWVLEGDECLVFFVGGIPASHDGHVTCLGFSLNPQGPTTKGGMREGPFFEFRSARLRDLRGRGFFSYLDLYGKGQPYAYFSAYGKENGYNRYGGTDCPSLIVWPYAEALDPGPRFLRPRGYQIISAGRDGAFGPGTDAEDHVWAPASAAAIPAAGRDDLSNFYRGPLGKPGME